MQPSSLLELLAEPDGRNTQRIYGVVVGIVTNNQDPDGLGRVKVRFPWLTDEDESHWARVATPMAGKDRGVFFLPEVDDEVMVAFEHGDDRFPYVIGALWNGKDTPPADNENGENNVRSITTRSGHVLRFDDTDGAEKIEIVDSSGKNRVEIDTSNNAITIEAEADITITSTSGKLALTGQEIELIASGEMTIKGATVNIN